MSEPSAKNSETPDFSPPCLSIDLEVGRRDGLIHAFAGVHGASGQAFVYDKGDLNKALEALDDFAQGAAFLLGHNLIAFDLPHLAKAKPDLRLLVRTLGTFFSILLLVFFSA
jgi:ATP-dependent DNA helicase RecQ